MGVVNLALYQDADSLRNRSVIAACSGGLEFGIVAEMPAALKALFPKPQKYLVNTFKYDREPSPEEPYGAFVVTDFDEQPHVVLPTQPIDGPFPAGGSINALFVLRDLGVSDGCLVCTVGDGERTKSIISTLANLKVKMYLLPAGGADTTLTFRSPEGSTLLCRKREPMPLTETIVAALRNAMARLLMLTSVKISNLAVAEHLVASPCQHKTFMPHKNLVESPDHRDRLLKLVNQVDMVQFNEVEAGALLGKTDFKEEYVSAMINTLPLKPGAVAIITLDKLGVYLLSKEDDPQFIPAIAVPPGMAVETSGPGDGLGAIFARYRYLSSQPFSALECTRMGAWGASHIVRHYGSWRGVPKHDLRTAAIAQIKSGRWPIDV